MIRRDAIIIFSVIEKVDANLTTCHQSSNIEDEIEVQIIGLKDIYNKKTRKTIEGPENRLEDSEVTVAIYPSEKITCVRAYVQRCPEAAIKTHDTIGWQAPGLRFLTFFV